MSEQTTTVASNGPGSPGVADVDALVFDNRFTTGLPADPLDTNAIRQLYLDACCT